MKTFDANWGPLSDMILSGVPKKRNTFLRNICASSRALHDLVQGINKKYLVKQLTITKIASVLLEIGKPVIKSIVIDFHDLEASLRGVNNP